jgi:hypothetical protein
MSVREKRAWVALTKKKNLTGDVRAETEKRELGY